MTSYSPPHYTGDGTLLLKLLSPSPYSMLDPGCMHWYDRINFSISSHVFNEPQEWIKSSATITGWFSVLRTQNKQPLYATHEYRRWSLYWTISCWKNPVSTELFNIDNSTAEKLILFPTYCSYILTLYIAHFYPYCNYGEFVSVSSYAVEIWWNKRFYFIYLPNCYVWPQFSRLLYKYVQ